MVKEYLLQNSPNYLPAGCIKLLACMGRPAQTADVSGKFYCIDCTIRLI